MPFDRDSGLTYQETFLSCREKDEDDLVYVNKRGHGRGRPKSECSIKGTRTLYSMAMLSILRNLDDLYPNLLKGYPEPILERIWKAISLKGLGGLRMWKLFASSGAARSLVRTVVKRPRGYYDNAIMQSCNIDCAWLTNLTLDAISLTMPQYVQLSSLPNLNSLAILSGPRKDTGFSDRVLRAWASDAQNGSFNKLRHILVSGHQCVTEHALKYLSFPMLDLFCAHNCQLNMSSRPNKEGAWHDPHKYEAA